jgi:hypothetical protein
MKRLSKMTKMNLKPGATVVLIKLPPGFLRGLSRADKKAISEVVGKPVRFQEYDEVGRAELQFTDSRGVIHFIYVKPIFLRSVNQAVRPRTPTR